MNAVLALGSNEGDRLRYLQQACSLIEKHIGTIRQASAVYQTAAWGKEDQADFLNQVLLVELSPTSSKDPELLIAVVLGIEQSLGRLRSEKWAARCIDIDILTMDDLIYNSDNLHVPHPELANRRFVLQPLAELLPDTVHPVLQQTFNQLLLACKDPLTVKRTNYENRTDR